MFNENLLYGMTFLKLARLQKKPTKRGGGWAVGGKGGISNARMTSVGRIRKISSRKSSFMALSSLIKLARLQQKEKTVGLKERGCRSPHPSDLQMQCPHDAFPKDSHVFFT